MNKLSNIIKTFNNLFYEGQVENNQFKLGLFKEYINLIKSNKILFEQFKLYTDIEGITDLDILKEYSDVAFTTFKNKFNLSDIITANKKLSDILTENNIILLNNDNIVFENIENIIYKVDIMSELKSKKNLCEIIKNRVSIIEPISMNETNDIFDVCKSVTDEINHFCEESLDESQQKMVKSIISEDIGDKMVFFNELKTEALKTINVKLKDTSDTELKEKILNVKERLLDTNFIFKNNEVFTEDIIKLSDLIDAIK